MNSQALSRKIEKENVSAKKKKDGVIQYLTNMNPTRKN